MRNIYTALLAASAMLGAGATLAQGRVKTHKDVAPATLQLAKPIGHTVHSATSLRGGGPPPNDECSGAVNEPLEVGASLTFSGDNLGATEDAPGFIMVWHAFTTTECANVVVNYCLPGSVFTDFLVNLAVQCADINAGLITSDTYDECTVTFPELAAGTYYLPVLVEDGYTPIGPYSVQVTAEACAPPPANDDCAQAASLTPAADCNPVAGTTEGANESMPAIACHGATSLVARDVWYSFTATDVAHTVTVEGVGNFDAVLEAFSGSCAELVSMGCQDSTFPSDGPATEQMVLTGLTIGDTYFVRVYDYGHWSTGHNFNICVTIGAPPAAYCTPSPENGGSDGDFIANVTLGDINNSTGGDNGYEDYTAMSTNLEREATYTISITNGDYGADVFAAWIDFNRDSIYQPSEKLGEFSGTTPGEVIEFTFTVPADASLGITRLHVRCAYSAEDMDPCEPYSYGETEDYGIEIVLPTGVHAPNDAGVAVYPNPTRGDVTISGAAISGKVQVELADMTGRTVFAGQYTMAEGQPLNLPLGGKLAQGTYMLRLITANGISSRPVMVK